MTREVPEEHAHPAAFEMTENMPVGMFVTESLPDDIKDFRGDFPADGRDRRLSKPRDPERRL